MKQNRGYCGFTVIPEKYYSTVVFSGEFRREGQAPGETLSVAGRKSPGSCFVKHSGDGFMERRVDIF